ncbi:MAG: endo alpha-1,4 polygalactosaminidase [Bacteroidales bacterium]|jgi:cysteinyl-tRNA synthetase|nr:endo alpha-1,4 polygalactosaminidase [Bacteroidales bacterium]
MKRIIIISILTATLLGCSKEKKSDLAAEKMQAFVSDISAYARNYDPDFIIIPQNGIELAFNNLEPGDGINTSYLSAIDGFGVEELFYNGPYAPDNERIAMLQQLKDSKLIMVSEYVSDSDNITDALSRNYTEGFICFPRISSNYHYHLIPDSVPHPNAFDITNLPDAQNYLYLISTDSFSSKQVMINEISATDFDIVLIDLFFNEIEFTPSEINQLKRKANGGQRLVISYLNIGSAEKFRYYWKPDWELHHPHWLKKKYEGYDDEIWVEFWEKEWQDIIFGNDNSYLKKILDAGFDGAYLDNVEAYYLLYFCH